MNNIIPSRLTTSNLRNRMFDPFEQAFNDFFNGFWKNSTLDSIKAKGNFPKLDIYSTDKEWIIEALMAGVDPNSVEVEVYDDSCQHPNVGKSVRIGGKSESRVENAQYHASEWSRSYSERIVSLPDDIKGDPEVTLKDGVLKLVWQYEPKPKEPIKKLIQIKKT